MLLLFSASEGDWISSLLSLKMAAQAIGHVLDVHLLERVHF